MNLKVGDIIIFILGFVLKYLLNVENKFFEQIFC